MYRKTADKEPEVERAHFKQAAPNNDITATELVSILYGAKTEFKYRLILDKDFPFDRILYR